MDWAFFCFTGDTVQLVALTLGGCMSGLRMDM